jgi:Ca2+-binding RTX toxin-like protein
VPATVSSSITTGRGHDGVWGGNGPDKINTGNDNDGGVEQASTLGPESIDGFGGDDTILLGTSDTINTDESPWFPFEQASGGDGNDDIIAKGISNVLNGDAGDDLLIGGKAFDTLVGGTGADRMRSGLGEDTIDATETPAQADPLVDCGKDGGVATFDIGIDLVVKDCN